MYACTKYIDLEIELDLEIIKTNILSKIHMIASKMWPLEC